MLGLSQSELAEGIMDFSNLSKFETGKQIATKSNLEHLLQRLGIQKQFLLDGYNSHAEQVIADMKREIDTFIFERKLEKAKHKLEQLSAMSSFNDAPQDKFNKQYLLRTKAAIAASLGDMAKTRELIFKALEITSGKFSEDSIATGVYTNYETDLINMLAVSYGESGERQKAIKILKTLIESMTKTNFDKYQKKPNMPGVIYNLSKYLSLEQRNEEAMQVCNRGIHLCYSISSTYALPDLYYNKAHLLHKLGQNDDCKRLLEVSCRMLWDMKQYKNALKTKLHIKEIFGMELDIYRLKDEMHSEEE